VIYLAVLSWLISIAPRKKIVDAAKLAVEAAEQALETANIEAKYIVEAAYKNAAAADLEASARLKVVKDATRQERATLEIAKNHLAEEETKLARVWLENAAQKKIQEDMKADRDALRGRF
jgi:ABC-type Na+ efflux pump permease subunit